MGLVKTRRLAAMQKQQKAKAGMRPPLSKNRLGEGVRGSSRLMTMAQAMGEYRSAMQGATDPESVDFNRGEYMLWKQRYEEELMRMKNLTSKKERNRK